MALEPKKPITRLNGDEDAAGLAAAVGDAEGPRDGVAGRGFAFCSSLPLGEGRSSGAKRNITLKENLKKKNPYEVQPR